MPCVPAGPQLLILQLGAVGVSTKLAQSPARRSEVRTHVYVDMHPSTAWSLLRTTKSTALGVWKSFGPGSSPGQATCESFHFSEGHIHGCQMKSLTSCFRYFVAKKKKEEGEKAPNFSSLSDPGYILRPPCIVAKQFSSILAPLSRVFPLSGLVVAFW